MSHKIVFSSRALRQFKKLSKADQIILGEEIDSLADTPFPNCVEKITAVDHCYRIRHGDYRIVYQVRNSELVVLLLAIGDRKDIYKDLVKNLKQLINAYELYGE
ncbi:MAG: type II toxin-antitoxin system RelE/ParE family toxin [candidate division Zixibacteria bacterium]|nr:type II toxin-antitoxin system RelE/ParE family toxin [candidate division Zixibacteria bacterium]